MPFRRCFNYDQETGEPLRSRAGIVGCPSGFHCPFVHPDSSSWERARRSRPKRGYSRDPSPNSASSHTSIRNSARLPPPDRHRYHDHRELSWRISEPKGLSSLGARLTDPEDYPPPESLVSRISEPPMPSGWASHAMNDVSSSTWNSTVNEDGASWSSSSVTTKPNQFIPPSRPVPTAPASIRNAFGPTPAQQRPTDNRETPLPPSSVSGPSPTLNKNISIPASQLPVAGPPSPSVARKPSISVPPSPVAVKQSPAFSPKPWSQSPAAPQQPIKPSLSPLVAPLPLQPLPQQSSQLPSPTPPSRPPPPSPPPPSSQRPPSLPPLPPTVGSASISPIQRPILDVRTSSVPLDHPSTPTATIQSPLALRPPSPDQKPTETMDTKDILISPELKTITARLRMLSRTVWYYQECKKADLAISHAHKERSSYKYHHIGERARARVEESVSEAESKAKNARRKLDYMISQFAENELWPTSLPQDGQLELIDQQVQEVQKQVTDISERLLVETSLPEDSMTVEQVTVEQNKLVDHFTQLESRQDDLENSVDQRLRDLDMKQESALSDLLVKSQMENKQAASEVKLLTEQLNTLAKQHEDIVGEVTKVYTQQAAAFDEIHKLQGEIGEWKKKCVMYEERDIQFRSELQAFIDSYEILKTQQTFSMRERVDQRLLDSMKTSLVMQLCQRIEERFSAARQEIEFRIASAQDVTAKEFDAKYGHVIDFLEQLRSHLRGTVNDTNGDITHK